jgi:uncharacterized protein
MARSPLRLTVLELRRRPGTQRDVEVTAPIEGLEITSARVPDGADVAVAATLEAIEGAITVTGTVTAPWEGECRRCLETVTGTIEAPLSEVFEPHPTEGETYPLEGDEVDLEPVVRDAVLLSLPLAPLCREDCAGPAPEAFPASVAGGSEADEGTDPDAERPPDPRWAALEQLKFD